MKPLQGLTVLVVLGVIITAGLMHFAKPVPVAKPDTVVVRQIVQAEAVRDTVRSTVVRFRDRVDTLNVHDTVRVREFIRSLDTVFVNCLKCADRIDSLVKVVRQLEDSLARCQGQRQRAQAQRPWWAVGGAILGGLSCRA